MRNITVKQYDESLATAWDEFIINHSRNGGMFQERKFLGYHQPGKFQDTSLSFYDENELVGVFPAAIIEEESEKTIVSHPGSSGGGLIYHNNSTLDTVMRMLEALIDHYKGIGAKAIEMKITEPIFNSFPDGELNYLLWHRGFKMTTQEISTCVKLSEFKSWEAMCRKRNLGYIRKLEREGVIVKESGEIEKMYAVIEKNLHARYNKKPTHSLEELKKIKELYPDRVHFWVAEKDNDILGVLVLFDVNKTGVHSFYIAKNEDFENVKAMPLLFHKVFEHYHHRGFSWFNFGISSRGHQIKWGILEFKETVGGRATTRQVWALPDLISYKKYENELSGESLVKKETPV